MEAFHLEAGPTRIGQLGEQHVALGERNHRAIGRRRIVDMVAGRDAPGRRHVLHDDTGTARNMLAEMARGEPRLEVIAAANAGSDNESHRLAGVEILRAG